MRRVALLLPEVLDAVDVHRVGDPRVPVARGGVVDGDDAHAEPAQHVRPVAVAAGHVEDAVVGVR